MNILKANCRDMFRGMGLYPHIALKLEGFYLLNLRKHHLLLAAENKMRIQDYLIAVRTIQIANTEITRKLYKDRIIKNYPKNAEFIRILK